MGNRMSSQASSKKRKKRIKRLKRRKEKGKNSEYIYEGGLEIQEMCEIEDRNDTTKNYWESYESCCKATRHKDFKPFETLTLEDLPEPIRHSAVYDYIRARGHLVVHISVKKKSPNREAENKGYGHFASGFACVCEDEVEADCPLVECRFSNESHKVYGGILIMTNRHVIIDDFECENSEFQFFFENLDSKRDSKAKGHGYALRDDSSENKDYVGVKIFLHDADTVKRIRQLSSDVIDAWQRIPGNMQTEFENHCVVISHPHGLPKQVSFGKLLEKERALDENENDSFIAHYYKHYKITPSDDEEENEKKKKKVFVPGRRVSRYTSMTCTGSSGSPVMTGFYWNNPFVHSSGFAKWLKRSADDEEDDEEVELEIWGESYFF